MPQEMIQRRAILGRVLAVAHAALFLGAIASAGAKVQAPKDAEPLPVVGGTRLVLLAPEVQFEDEATEQRLDPAKFQGDEIVARVDRLVRAAVRARGLTIGEPGAGTYPEASKLVRAGALPEGVCAGTGAATSGVPVLAVQARVIVGSGGSWNPNTGAITSASHRTRLRAALVDCGASRTLWRSELIFRRIPDLAKRDIDRAIAQLLGGEDARPVEVEER